MNPLLSFPAHLMTGNHSSCEKQVLEWLKEIFLPHHTCNNCAVCSAIQEKNFYGFSWFVPENKYTIETIEPIFHKISFQLSENEHYFFVITRAELLTPACANMLLKAVEEPPRGYHFIFIAPHKNLVLPTIVSRCVEYSSIATSSDTSLHSHPLVVQACSFNFDVITVYKEIASYDLNEHETLILFETLLGSLTHLYTKKLEDDKHIHFSLAALQKLQGFCKSILEKPLQPGSSKMIWKDFFMYKTLVNK